MYAGMLYIGPRPVIREPRKKGFISVYERQVSVEAHLFDFTERVYGCHIRLFFVCKLRNNRKFRSKEGLIRYLARDKEKTLQVLRKKKEPSFPLNCFTSPFRGDTMKPKW